MSPTGFSDKTKSSISRDAIPALFPPDTPKAVEVEQLLPVFAIDLSFLIRGCRPSSSDMPHQVCRVLRLLSTVASLVTPHVLQCTVFRCAQPNGSATVELDA